MFLNSINHFRAIAIVFIVTGHCFRLTNITFDSPTENIIRTLVDGGTTLFVFISGFLFHYVFYEKYQYRSFIIKKIKNVFVPYLILSALPIINDIINKKPYFGGYFLPSDTGFLYEYLVPTLKYYVTGRHFTAYWYIPFIMITFLMSPVHIWFIEQKTKFQILIVIFFVIISSLIHRPPWLLNVFQHVVYYFPIYLIGILCSMNKEKIYLKLEGKELYLLVSVFLLAIIQVAFGQTGNYYKAAFAYNGLDLMIFQKIILSVFFMVWLHRFENIKKQFISVVASTSFTIFFIHPIILRSFAIMDLTITSQEPWLFFPLIVIMIILVCIALALVLKKLLPKYSRYITGY